MLKRGPQARPEIMEILPSEGPYRHDHHRIYRLLDGHDLEVRRAALGTGGEGERHPPGLGLAGGYTRSPAAVTGPHWAGGNIPPSTMPSRAEAVAPLARVTVCVVPLRRNAALPSWFPLRSVAE